MIRRWASRPKLLMCCCCHCVARKRKSSSLITLVCTGFLVLAVTTVLISCLGLLFASHTSAGVVVDEYGDGGRRRRDSIDSGTRRQTYAYNDSVPIDGSGNHDATKLTASPGSGIRFWAAAAAVQSAVHHISNLALSTLDEPSNGTQKQNSSEYPLNRTGQEATTSARPSERYQFFSPVEAKAIYKAVDSNAIIKLLMTKTRTLCDGHLNLYGSCLVELLNVTIVRRYATNVRGGEKLESVLGQKEKMEYFSVTRGFYSMPLCNDGDLRTASGVADKYLRPWVKSIKTGENLTSDDGHPPAYWAGLSITIVRNEYANLYWTLIDIYDIFLLAHGFLVRPQYVTIIIMDAHPQGLLDPLWSLVFGKVVRFKELPPAVTFKHMVWSMHRSKGPLAHIISAYQLRVPFLEDLRDVIQKKLHVVQSTASVQNKCTTNTSLNILFVLRRDYVAHARNPTGKILRKLSNEQEILQAVTDAYPTHSVAGLQLETVSIDDQIRNISNTDILIGVHGAGLAHVIFQQVGRAVIEIFPSAYGIYKNDHFERLARWSGVHYLKFHNVNQRLQDRRAEFIRLQPRTIILLIKNAISLICKQFNL